ncbi:AEC family transporter [Roseomonas sp. NAR14]|uniref:AEC family transporter n=1 Tax=Roseomonas acroporae TaxID=2937791 RepID=A0A9X1Y6D2_9PROT|nr:AEC family transporter [Roseomonas acroporae]MCK8782837.1 AEC family transporter [Roseomonas acroporae]
MTGVLVLVAPIFALVALGAVAARFRWLTPEGFRGVNDFVFTLASPALLFANGMSGQAGRAQVAVVFFAACFAVYGLALPIGRRLLGLDLTAAGLFALNAVFGNTLMLGVPIVLAAYGQAGLSLLLGIVALHALLLLPVATAVAELGLGGGASVARILYATLRSVLRNPMVVAVAAAFVLHHLGLVLPDLLRRILEWVGGTTSPLALFCLGGSLVGFGGVRELRDSVVASVLKLLVMPALALLLCRLAEMTPLETAVVVTAAALPTGANAFILARRYTVGADRSASTVLFSTMVSVLTLALLLGWFGVG